MNVWNKIIGVMITNKITCYSKENTTLSEVKAYPEFRITIYIIY